MKILLLDQFNQPGGAQQCLLELLPELIQRGWDPVVMLPGEGPLGKKIRSLGIEVLPVACGPYRSGYKTTGDALRFLSNTRTAAAQIARVCEVRDVNTIYVNGPRLVPAAAIAARGKRRIVFHCHSFLSPRYLEWITAIPLRWKGAMVVGSSKFVLRPLRRWIPAPRVTVVYNGIPEAMERKHPRGPKARIGVIGRIAREKGQDIFVRAAELVHRKIPECQFVVCGAPLFSDSEFERAVRRLAERLPIDFLGWQENVGAVMAGLDLLVVPSTSIDATPLVIPQAFAARLPVLAFANEGFQELIENGRNGFLLQERTPAALAVRICELLLGSPQKLDDVAQAAYLDWGARYTLATYRAGIANVLEQMA